jgi:probable rRNA maturation factor
LGFIFKSKLPEFQLDNVDSYINWLNKIATLEEKRISEIVYVFVNKSEILTVNKRFLDHHYHTDVITFNNSFLDFCSGEVYICIPVVKENAIDRGEIFKLELGRIIVHGLLHIFGYDDKSRKDRSVMRKLENHYLDLL